MAQNDCKKMAKGHGKWFGPEIDEGLTKTLMVEADWLFKVYACADVAKGVTSPHLVAATSRGWTLLSDKIGKVTLMRPIHGNL